MKLASTANPLLIRTTIAGVDLYHDRALGITWHGDGNLAARETFALARSANLFPGAGEIGSTGLMNWNTAILWIEAMNAAMYLGFGDWRLPQLGPVSGSTLNTAFSNNATTDLGYARTTTDGSDGGWRDDAGNPVSEMGFMHYVRFAQKGYCEPNDSSPGTCTEQGEAGLARAGPIASLESGLYWSGVESGSDLAWYFDFHSGLQGALLKTNNLFAWAVRR